MGGADWLPLRTRVPQPPRKNYLDHMPSSLASKDAAVEQHEQHASQPSFEVSTRSSDHDAANPPCGNLRAFRCAARGWLLQRYLVAGLAAVAGAVMYSQRYGLAIAIVRMQSTFGWSRHTQGQILASFFLGYMLAQLPAGWFAARYGPRRCVLISLVASASINLLLPVAASTSSDIVSVLRFVQGIAQGVLFPGIAALLSTWAPPLERSRLDGIPRAGAFLGAMLCNALAGVQCDSAAAPIAGGWQGVFLLWGLVGLSFSVVWWAYVYDTPDSDPRCSQGEAAFIQAAIQRHMDAGNEAAAGPVAAGSTAAAETNTRHRTESGRSTDLPSARELSAWALYGHILRSSACWAIAICHTAYDIGLYILDDGLPPFLRDVLGMDLSAIGFMLAVPGLFKPLVILVFAALADSLRSRGMRTLHVRKLITMVAFLPQIGFLLLLGFGLLREPHSIGLLMACVLPLGLAANGGGYIVNHLDIAPTAASLVLAFYNTGGQVAGWTAPYLIGELTAYPDGLSREQHVATNGTSSAVSPSWVSSMDHEWCVVFLIGAALQMLGGGVYLALASDQVQPWVPKRRLAGAARSA